MSTAMDGTPLPQLAEALLTGTAPAQFEAYVREGLSLLGWSVAVSAELFLVLGLALACVRVPAPSSRPTRRQTAPLLGVWHARARHTRHTAVAVVARSSVTLAWLRARESLVTHAARTGLSLVRGASMLLLYVLTLAWHGAAPYAQSLGQRYRPAPR